MLKRSFNLKKWQKITLYSLLVVCLAGFVLYQYAVRHAASILEDLVDNKSNGKVALKVNTVKFRWAKNTIQLNNAHIYNTERNQENSKYDFYIQQLSLNLTDVLGLIIDNDISINEISLTKPKIVVETAKKLEENNALFSEEAGNVFSSIQDGLHAVQVDKFQLKDGSFTLIQATDTIPTMISLSQFNLQIDNFNPENVREDQLLFSDNIYFEAFDQNLIFPDGKYKIKFQKLSIGTQDAFIQLDSCLISNVHKNQTKGNIDLYFDTLRLTGLDFKKLYQDDFIVADSMYGKNAQLDLAINLQSKNNQNALDSVFASLGVDIDLRFIGIENLSTNIQTSNQGKKAAFSTNGDDISIQQLKIRSSGDKFFEIDQFEIALRDYISYTADSLYQFKFDSIKVVNSSIVLSNLNVQSYKNKNVKENYVVPQFVLNDLDWEELLMSQQIIAKNATLFQPKLYFNQFVKNRKEDSKSLYDVFSDIRKFVSMDNIRIVEGNLAIHTFNNTSFLFEDISCKVSILELLKAESSSMIESAVESFQFNKGTVEAAGLNLHTHHVVYNTLDTYFHIDSLFLTDSTSQLSIDAYKVWLHGPYFDEVNSYLQLDSLKWEQGNLAYQKGNEKDKPFPISVFINYIQGEETSFDLAFKQNIEGYLNQINAYNIEVNEEKIFKIQQVDAEGKRLKIFDEQMSVFTNEFVISDHQSSRFKNFEFNLYNHPDTLRVLADEIDFHPGNTNLKEKKFEVDRLALFEPTVIFNKYPTKRDSVISNVDTIEFLFKDLVFLNPNIIYNVHYENRIDNITWDKNNSKENDSLSIKNGYLKLDSNINVTIQQILLAGNQITINESFGFDFTYEAQPIHTAIKDIQLYKKAGQQNWVWSGFIESFAHKGIGIGGLTQKESNLLITEGSYTDIWMKSQWKDIFETLKNNPHLKAKIGASAYSDGLYILEWDSLAYTGSKQEINIYNWMYQPAVSLNEFLKTLEFQNDYLQLEIPFIKLNNLQWIKQDDQWQTHIGTMLLQKLNLSAYRDKHLPIDTNALKKLPVEILSNLNFSYLINEIHVQQAKATYSELGWNKKDTGIVQFTDLNGTIKNVKNIHYQPDDSLYVFAKAILFNQLPVELNFRQSYVNIDRGFKVNMMLGEGDLRSLNQAFLTLANVGIQKGRLQNLNLQVLGNDEYAWGKALMQYKKLYIRVNQKESSSIAPIKTFLANAFVLNHKNKKQEKIIFVERLKDRSIFNYLVKMVFDAAATTVGVKKDRVNKKLIQQHQLEKDKL